MVQLGLPVDLKPQLLQWDGINVPMKEPRDMLVKPDTTSCEMHEVVMQTEEPVSTIQDTEILVKILDSTNAKEDLKQVTDNATKLKTE